MVRYQAVSQQPSPAVDSRGFAHGFVALEDDTHFLYRPRISTPRIASAPSAGTTPRSASAGLSWARRCAPPKDADAPLLADADCSEALKPRPTGLGRQKTPCRLGAQGGLPRRRADTRRSQAADLVQQPGASGWALPRERCHTTLRMTGRAPARRPSHLACLRIRQAGPPGCRGSRWRTTSPAQFPGRTAARLHVAQVLDRGFAVGPLRLKTLTHHRPSKARSSPTRPTSSRHAAAEMLLGLPQQAWDVMRACATSSQVGSARWALDSSSALDNKTLSGAKVSASESVSGGVKGRRALRRRSAGPPTRPSRRSARRWRPAPANPKAVSRSQIRRRFLTRMPRCRATTPPVMLCVDMAKACIFHHRLQRRLIRDACGWTPAK